MKRVHLFEFEDFTWFPSIWRDSMTNLIIVMHKLLDTKSIIKRELKSLIEETNQNRVVDFCSGSGGPMPSVLKELNEESQATINLTLTDLFPNKKSANYYNNEVGQTNYIEETVDATLPNEQFKGIRSMICSFHHMSTQNAQEILKSAQESNQPMFIFEMSDNSAPKVLRWIAFPINILTCLLITPFSKPFSLTQLIFTYIIPIIPITFAWDGAVSNARTYTPSDLKELIEPIKNKNYQWEIKTIKGKGKFMCIIGRPAIKT